MPLSYFDPSATMTSASEGSDRLVANAHMIRPRIGGGRKRSTLRKRGGFVPSVMEGFVSATSKYLAPIALMMMYKYVNKGTSKAKSKAARKASKPRKTHRRRRV